MRRPVVRRLTASFAALIALLLAAACGAGGGDAGDTGLGTDPVDSTRGSFELTSSAFSSGGVMPVRLAREGAEGDDESIPYEWTGAPEATRSFALLLIDTHPVAGDWVHWIVVDIPAGTSELALGASGSTMPSGSRELLNSWGEPGYGGPEPPPGTGTHEYLAKLYALDVRSLEVAEDAGVQGLLRAMEGHVLAEASYAGVFGR